MSARPHPLGAWLPILLLITLVAAVFANAIGGDFVFDDYGDITANPSAKAETFFARLGTMNRPLTKATYALQDPLHGPNPAAFHAVNVVLHLAAALLVFALVRRAWRWTVSAPSADWAALAVTAIWAVHPALTETATYVSGRSMALSSVLVLGALLACSGRLSWRNAGIGLLCALLAPLARETALILPVIALWWVLTVQPREGWHTTLKRVLPIISGVTLAALVIMLTPRHQELIGESLRSRPPLEALQGNVHAAIDILASWFTPSAVTIDPAPPLAWPWSDARTLAKLAALAAIGLVALALRRRAPLAAFGLGLALLALAPSNSILWRADPVSLKPLYLGGLGLTLALAALVTHLPRPAAIATTIFLVATLSILTVQRNALFADEIALWRDAAETTPDYGRPWIMLGYALFNAQRYREALAALERGTDLMPWDAQAAEARALVERIVSQTP